MFSAGFVVGVQKANFRTLTTKTHFLRTWLKILDAKSEANIGHSGITAGIRASWMNVKGWLARSYCIRGEKHGSLISLCVLQNTDTYWSLNKQLQGTNHELDAKRVLLLFLFCYQVYFPSFLFLFWRYLRVLWTPCGVND